MPHAENSVTIAKPIDQVFRYVADGLNNPKWRGSEISISLKSGNAGTVGAVYAQTMPGPGGRGIPADYELTEVVPNQTIVFHVVAGPARPVGTYTFSEVPGGTLVRFALSWEPKGLMQKLMAPMVAKQMPKEVAALEGLKRTLEA